MNYYEDFDNCLSHVILSLKKLLYSRHEDIFERIDFYDDSIYQEPLLFTYVHQSDDKWIDSIIYGYESKKKEVIEVFSNESGVIYVPKVGYFLTDKISAKIFLHTTNNGGIKLKIDGVDLDYVFEPLIFLKNNIEIVKHHHPLLNLVFTDQGKNVADIRIDNIYKQHIESFNKGMAIIQEHNSEHYSLLKKNLKKVMLFSSEKQNSFAVLSAHNMIFLNVNSWDDEIFFADHISHEGAHITFFTLTYESKSDLFKCHFNTPWGNFIGEEGKYGPIYLKFHGLFTFIEISKTLAKCVNNNTYSKKQNNEIIGRFLFHMLRFEMQLKQFSEIDILTDEGMIWFNIFTKGFEKMKDQYDSLLPSYSLCDQPYDFSNKIFSDINNLSE